MWEFYTSAAVRELNAKPREVTFTLKAPPGMQHVVSKETNDVPFKLFKYSTLIVDDTI